MDDLEDIAKLGQTPLPADAPSFEKFKDDDDYENLRNIFSPSNYEEKKWNEILESATEIFENKAKHLQIAQWICEALINLHAYSGLDCGLKILHDLLQNDEIWKIIEPVKVERRAKRIVVFENKTLRWLKEPTNAEIKHIKASFTKLEAIKKLLNKRFPESGEIIAPDFSDLENKLKPHIGIENTNTKVNIKPSDASLSLSNVPVNNISMLSLENVKKEARNLANKGKLEEGLNILQQRYLQANHVREQFFWSLAKVRLLYLESKIALAVFNLTALEQIVKDYKLEEWEPDLSIEVAELLLMCAQEDVKKIKNSSDTDNAYKRLCRLDMARSLKYEPKK